jgi:hypothetical protein
MSHRGTWLLAVAVGLGCAMGAFFWLRARINGGRSAMAAARIYSAPPAAPNVGKIPVVKPEAAIAPSESKEPAAAEKEMSLRTGEVLEFTANVSKLSNVANLRLQVAEHRNFLGKSAWHLQAFAHTENPLRMVFELDDQFDSYSDAAAFTSLQYEMHLNERGQKVESVQRMLPSGKEPAPADAIAARVLPGTRDPLGMMQYLRKVDWSKTPEVRSAVYDGHKLYDVRAIFAGSGEAVAVPAGNFTASKIDLKVFENGVESKDAHFTLYLSNDAAHTPVLLEATMPFATARVELAKSH